MPDSTAATLDTSIDDTLLQLVDKDALIKKLDMREDSGGRRIIAGYANVANIVDSQGDIMSREALVNAWEKWRANPDFCILSLLHSNIPLAKVVFDEVIDSKGAKHVSCVDDTGLYIVAEVRSDVTLADEVWGKIERGEFRGFSIGGRNLAPQPTTCIGETCSRPITSLELYEVAIVDKPANEESLFNMLKSDDLAKLADATKDIQEQLLVEGAVKISRRPCPVTGQYKVLIKEGLDASKLFDQKRFAIAKESAEGDDYVSLFDVALLRPESVLTGETVGGGVNPSPPQQAATPDTPTLQEGQILENKVEEVKTEPSSKDESGTPKAPDNGAVAVEKSTAPAPAPAPPAPEPVKETVIQAPAAPPQPAPAPTPEPTQVKVEPVTPPPAPAPTPPPPPVAEVVETRGVTQPPAAIGLGLNLGEIHTKVSWKTIHEAMASSKRK